MIFICTRIFKNFDRLTSKVLLFVEIMPEFYEFGGRDVLMVFNLLASYLEKKAPNGSPLQAPLNQASKKNECASSRTKVKKRKPENRGWGLGWWGGQTEGVYGLPSDLNLPDADAVLCFFEVVTKYIFVNDRVESFDDALWRIALVALVMAKGSTDKETLEGIFDNWLKHHQKILDGLSKHLKPEVAEGREKPSGAAGGARALTKKEQVEAVTGKLDVNISERAFEFVLQHGVDVLKDYTRSPTLLLRVTKWIQFFGEEGLCILWLWGAALAGNTWVLETSSEFDTFLLAMVTIIQTLDGSGAKMKVGNAMKNILTKSSSETQGVQNMQGAWMVFQMEMDLEDLPKYTVPIIITDNEEPGVENPDEESENEDKGASSGLGRGGASSGRGRGGAAAGRGRGGGRTAGGEGKERAGNDMEEDESLSRTGPGNEDKNSDSVPALQDDEVIRKVVEVIGDHEDVKFKNSHKYLTSCLEHLCADADVKARLDKTGLQLGDLTDFKEGDMENFFPAKKMEKMPNSQKYEKARDILCAMLYLTVGRPYLNWNTYFNENFKQVGTLGGKKILSAITGCIPFKKSSACCNQAHNALKAATQILASSQGLSGKVNVTLPNKPKRKHESLGAGIDDDEGEDAGEKADKGTVGKKPRANPKPKGGEDGDGVDMADGAEDEGDAMAKAFAAACVHHIDDPKLFPMDLEMKHKKAAAMAVYSKFTPELKTLLSCSLKGKPVEQVDSAPLKVYLQMITSDDWKAALGTLERLPRQEVEEFIKSHRVATAAATRAAGQKGGRSAR